MLAAEGGFAGLIPRGKGAARKFTELAGSVCWGGTGTTAAAPGKLKGECLARWESSEVGFPL